VYLPTNDVWVRDYGPFVGLDGSARVAVAAHYDPEPNYPHEADDAMPQRWAAHHGIAARQIALHIEGGNLISDGAGTLLMSDRFERQGLRLSRDDMAAALHEVFSFDKLIVTPHLSEEATGHIDLLVKLADAETVLVTAPGDSINAERLAEAAATFHSETNARGLPYHVLELPGLPPYYNWGVYPIWRSYTNALTVNGRVLVPTYGEKSDDQALAIYEDALPHYSIIPIDCRVAINGGGAVHCLSKEVPRA
jgi:agmatine deiminase